MSIEILGIDLYHILSWFIVYSFVGWVWESCYVSIKNRRWVNRGFINGPFVTIYGVGAVLIYVILRPLEGNLIGLYFGGMALATALEYVTGVLMEMIFHTNWWDYSAKRFNFQGKICLGSSIAWGFFTLALFYIFQPPVAYLVDLVSREQGVFLVKTWLIVYAVDFGFSTAAAFDLKGKLQKLDSVKEELLDFLKESKLYEGVEELRDRAEDYRMELERHRFSEISEEKKKKFYELLERLGESDGNLRDRKQQVVERYDEMIRRYGEIRKSFGSISKRHIKAYPNLISKKDRLIRYKKNRKQR